jgi:TrmH family RNA methyltransferase
MLSKNKIKWIRSLENKKARDAEKLFIAEGHKIVGELLHSAISTVALFSTQEWIEQNSNYKKYFPKDTFILKKDEIDKISFLKTPQEVVAIAQIPEFKIAPILLTDKLTLILDKLQDPGNLGTIIRLADWFGIENIICSQDTADAYNPKVVQASMGAIFRVKIIYSDLVELIPQIKKNNIPIYATALDGENIYNTKLSDNGIIVMGNESKGVNDKLQSFADKKLFIPNYPLGSKNTESLNVGIATAIICSEFRRTSLLK